MNESNEGTQESKDAWVAGALLAKDALEKNFQQFCNAVIACASRPFSAEKTRLERFILLLNQLSPSDRKVVSHLIYDLLCKFMHHSFYSVCEQDPPDDPSSPSFGKPYACLNIRSKEGDLLDLDKYALYRLLDGFSDYSECKESTDLIESLIEKLSNLPIVR